MASPFAIDIFLNIEKRITLLDFLRQLVEELSEGPDISLEADSITLLDSHNKLFNWLLTAGLCPKDKVISFDWDVDDKGREWFKRIVPDNDNLRNPVVTLPQSAL